MRNGNGRLRKGESGNPTGWLGKLSEAGATLPSTQRRLWPKPAEAPIFFE